MLMLELDINVTSSIWRLLCKYATNLSLEIPQLALTRKQQHKLINNYDVIKWTKKTSLNRLYAQVTYKSEKHNIPYDIVFLNTDKLDYLNGLGPAHLEDSLIHELIHIKYRKLRHGKKFERFIYDVYNKYSDKT
jgi:hypothetical protein